MEIMDEGSPEWKEFVAKHAQEGENVKAMKIANKVFYVVMPPGLQTPEQIKPGDEVTYIDNDGARTKMTIPTKEVADKWFGLFQTFLGLGRTVLVKALPDQESLRTPGQMCVLSEPMDKFITFESFLDELASFMREPLFPLEEMVLKECTCKELSETSFLIKVEHDIEKYKRFGFPVRMLEGMPLIRTWYTCSYSYEERIFRTIDHGLKGPPHVNSTSETYFHKEPLRVEFHIADDKMPGGRIVGPFAAQWVQNFFINPILLKVQKRVATIVPDADSILNEGLKSVLSEGLDEFCNYDEVYDGIVDSVKAGFKIGHANAEEEIEEPSEHQMILTLNKDKFREFQANPKQDQATPFFAKMVVDHNREESYINVETVFGTGEPMSSHFFLHQCPLRVEFWMMKDGERLSGRGLGGRLQAMLDTIIAKNESGWFW